MKTLDQTKLENMIWLRETMISKKQDVSKIDAEIAGLRAIIGQQRKLLKGKT